MEEIYYYIEQEIEERYLNETYSEREKMDLILYCNE